MSNQSIPSVNVDELKTAIDNHDTFILLDVRTPGEYSRGKITGSVNLPVDEVEANVEKVIPDKHTKVMVYCLSGSRSVIAVEIMRQLGYSNVFNVTSGLLVWRIKQYPLEV